MTALILASSTTAGEKPAIKGPLADLPSPPGPHVAKIKAMKDGEWLLLGAPAPDPKWGPAPGRAYTNKMAYAPDLVGGFLVGEGVHGKSGSGPREGYYNDDVFFYDLMAHRYVCLYPGTKIAGFKVTRDDKGFLVDEEGQHPPIAIAVHGYECSCYIPETHEFMTLLTGSPYARKIRDRLTGMVKDLTIHTRNGGMWYNVICPAADNNPIVNDAPGEALFLDYLEFSIRWAGFLGLENCEGHTWPVQDLARGLKLGGSIDEGLCPSLSDFNSNRYPKLGHRPASAPGPK